jgi:trans-aconitate methyltransferase
MNTTARIEFGDFQTPLPLAREICASLESRGVPADVIIEPTCGLGVFLRAAAECYPKAELRGFDIKSDYVAAAAKSLSDLGVAHRTAIQQQDFFTHDWNREVKGATGAILILGNLP